MHDAALVLTTTSFQLILWTARNFTLRYVKSDALINRNLVTHRQRSRLCIATALVGIPCRATVRLDQVSTTCPD